MSLIKRIKQIFQPRNPSEEEKLFDQLSKFGCPDCGCSEFQEGPSASIAVNIRCANEECHSEFNIAPMMRFAERINHVAKG